jgi:hypothetical protein
MPANEAKTTLNRGWTSLQPMSPQAVIHNRGASAVRWKRKPHRSTANPMKGVKTIGRTVDSRRLASLLCPRCTLQLTVLSVSCERGYIFLHG